SVLALDPPLAWMAARDARRKAVPERIDPKQIATGLGKASPRWCSYSKPRSGCIHASMLTKCLLALPLFPSVLNIKASCDAGWEEVFQPIERSKAEKGFESRFRRRVRRRNEKPLAGPSADACGRAGPRGGRYRWPIRRSLQHRPRSRGREFHCRARRPGPQKRAGAYSRRA